MHSRVDAFASDNRNIKTVAIDPKKATTENLIFSSFFEVQNRRIPDLSIV